MTRKDTLQGALVQLCHRTSLAWLVAANSDSDSLIARAQRLSVVANEVSGLYEDEAGRCDELLDAHGKAHGLALTAMYEWEWGEIKPQELRSMMLKCARAYQKAAECGSSSDATPGITHTKPLVSGLCSHG